jgi:2-dehydro-3-deoxyphosphogluconate aldolase / (4S)-4-hydroxy-2-oxoglutarate aldolase
MKPLAQLECLWRQLPLLPVAIVHDVEEGVALADMLSAVGVPMLEITLRTPKALLIIETIRKERPNMVVGAGTVCDLYQLEAARQAGACFAVSPGATKELLNAGQDYLLPGVATPSEIMVARAAGYKLMKFFPAAACGGPAALAALAGPFSDVRLVPTGGIDSLSANAYLNLPNVVAIGGSWLLPRHPTRRNLEPLRTAVMALRR